MDGRLTGSRQYPTTPFPKCGWTAIPAAIFLLALSAGQPANAADAIKMQEPFTDTRVFAVSTQVGLEGTITAPGRDGKPAPVKLTGAARFKGSERRLPGTGRDAEALRSVRYFDEAGASVVTGDFRSQRMLRPTQRLMVAEGRREGIRQFSPAGPLTYDELDLLQIPGDSLALLGLLPDRAVEPGETWKPAEWVMQTLTGLETVEKSKLVCKLVSVTNFQANVDLDGEVEGADMGTTSKVTLTGSFIFDLKQNCITTVELQQTEKRQPGVLNPQFDITARVSLTRAPMDKPSKISEADLKDIPLDPNPANLLLVFESPDWGVRFYHDRSWHTFHQTKDVAILRMMHNGGIIAQCNINPINPKVEPGQHITEERFKADIQKSLGSSFQQILQAKVLETTDKTWLYQVAVAGAIRRPVKVKPDDATASGEGAKTPAKPPGKAAEAPKPAATAKGADKGTDPKAKAETSEVGLQEIPYQWIYNVAAAPDGRQVVFTFIIEADVLETFATQDASMLGTLEFLAKP